MRLNAWRTHFRVWSQEAAPSWEKAAGRHDPIQISGLAPPGSMASFNAWVAVAGSPAPPPPSPPLPSLLLLLLSALGLPTLVLPLFMASLLHGCHARVECAHACGCVLHGEHQCRLAQQCSPHESGPPVRNLKRPRSNNTRVLPPKNET